MCHPEFKIGLSEDFQSKLYLIFPDDTSDDEDIGQEMFQSQFDVNRSGLNDYAANRASLDLSDFESNRLSFTEHDTPCSDQESMKEFSDFNDHNQAQSESNR